MSTTGILGYAKRLLQSGAIPIPLCPQSKHIDFRAMGLMPYHTITATKRFKDVAYQSLAFHLALRPPNESDLARWFSGQTGNIGIVGGYRGLIVLDFDDMATFARWAHKYPSLAQQTPAEKTPAGCHVYLKCETPFPCTSLYFSATKAGHLTAFGGYVACSPSVLRDGGEYEWLPRQSPFEVELAAVPDLRSISMHPTGWVRRHYRRLLGRGGFDPAETMTLDEFRKM